MKAEAQTRSYVRSECVAFSKTKEQFGGLSNMAAGFPLCVNGVRILTSEALYQACRFPHMPEVQKLIISESSPMTAKMKSKPYRRESRADWDIVRVKVMRWCLRVKLAQNWRAFSELLLETGERPIVEESRKDDFWGAKANEDGTLVGMNVLGRLLMELREAVKVEGRASHEQVQPLAIPEFLLMGRPIGVIRLPDTKQEMSPALEPPIRARGTTVAQAELQPSLFGGLAAKEASSPVYLGASAPGIRIAELRRYSAYKETSQAWLGEVPRHWTVSPNRALFGEVKDRQHPDEEMLSVTITKGIVRQKSLLEGSSKKDSSNLDKSAYKLVQPRDIAYNKMRAWQGAIGASVLRGIISPAYVVMRLRNNDDLPSYFHHLYRTPQFAKEAERWSYGITSDMWSLRPEHFKMIYTPQPPPDEQVAIVRFLDWANGRLERAIRAKRKVIALLNEQKQAIIHRAVTCGLDPSVPLKPSGIPWLGDIPRHWEILALKRVLRRLIDCEHKTAPPVVESAFRVVRTTGIRNGALRVEGTYCTSPAAFRAWTRRGLPEPGDVIFTREAPAGEACLVPDYMNFCLGQRTVLMKPRVQRLDPQFLVHMIYAGPPRVAITQASQGSTVAHFNMSDIGALTILLPPKHEQNEIVAAIVEKTSGLDTAISRLEREIALLREYRTRLVADVVTGKLDVREAAARLPDVGPLDLVEADVDRSDETESADEEAAA